MLHLIGQSLVVVKECLGRLPTTASLLWGNFSRGRLLQKAYFLSYRLHRAHIFGTLVDLSSFQTTVLF